MGFICCLLYILSCLLYTWFAAIGNAAEKPNIVLILADDFGWANIGYHRKDARYFQDDALDHPEIMTPTLDYLASNYVKLDRFYSYKMCGPSRCSLQTGRLAVHVSLVNTPPESYNPEDKESGYAGIPRHMTGIAEKLKGFGYKTHLVGKWDVGMATKDHTPLGRGYDSFLGYYHPGNDYWTQNLTIFSIGAVNVCGNKYVSLARNHRGEKRLHGTAYEEELFLQESLSIIHSHDTSNPLFLFHSFHLVHTPLQVPEVWTTPFRKIDYENRRLYSSMVWYMDHAVGSLMNALITKGLWNNTILLFSSDNGGAIYHIGSANNYPLRGGKYNDFEGGVRVNAFLAGGAVPEKMRGTTISELVHMSDIYPTFIAFAGGSDKDAIDTKAEKYNLPPVDGLNMKDLFLGKTKKSPRNEIHLSEKALLSGKYKILVGTQPNGVFLGPIYPNITGVQPTFPSHTLTANGSMPFDCGTLGCLFNVFDDPTEHNDLAGSMPELREELKARLVELNKSVFRPNRGLPSKLACKAAKKTFDGFYGPFIEVDD